MPRNARRQAMSIEENRAIVRRFVEECWGKANMNVADELCDPNYVAHGSASPNLEGIEAVKQFLRDVHTDNPDVVPHINDIIAEGDKVVVRVTAQGVADPWSVITIFRIVDGKIVDDWGLVGKPWT
jgi:predicted SnoaL-like aldol condensation-catalyzing enzyme